MRDFNTVKSDLIQHLKLSCQKTDGEILWYDGTLDVLVEFLSILRQKADGGLKMAEYIEREAVNALIKAECSPKVAAYLIDAVATVPAADVRPVVRGEWIYDHWCEFKCSNCGAWSKSEPYRGRENFCPNCGAMMEES